jgi:hypothetical protein
MCPLKISERLWQAGIFSVVIDSDLCAISSTIMLGGILFQRENIFSLISYGAHPVGN